MAQALRFSGSFGAADPFAVVASQRHAAELVTAVTEETRKAIRDIVTRAIGEGIAPKDAAKLVKATIGLTAKQAQSVATFYLKQQQVSPSTAMAKAEKYGDRLLKFRAETIARTEIMRAQNAGQLAAWDEAVRKGLVGASSQKTWIVAPDDRLCPTCATADGETVALEAEFSLGVTTPPAHPRCRCTMGLKPARATGHQGTASPAGRTAVDMGAVQHRQGLASAASARKAASAARAAEKQAAIAARQAAKAAAQAAQEMAAQAAAQAAAEAAVAAAEQARLLAIAEAEQRAIAVRASVQLQAERKVGSKAWIDGMLSRGRVGEQLGSNPGGTFQDAWGNRYYVKQYRDRKQALSESVSNRIYRDLKLGAPKSVVVKSGDGTWHFASRIVENKGTVGKAGLTKKTADKILDGFSADVLTVNWDAVGTGLDNVVLAGTKVLRIDQGGTLMFRAQGGAKPPSVLSSIGEWQSFRNQNAYYRQVFDKAGLGSADDLAARAIRQIDDIEALRAKAGGWEKFVRKALWPTPLDRETRAFARETAQLLEARTRLLLQKRAELQSMLSAPPAPVRHAGSWPIDDSVIRFRGRNLPETLKRQANASRWEHGETARDTIQRYTSSGYAEMNARLRANPSAPMNPNVKAMQKALESSTPPKGVDLVWRGQNGWEGKALAEKWKAGDMVQLNGFQSTSIDPMFANSWGSEGVLLEIKPVRGMFVEHISRSPGEWEFILPHAQRYRVVGRKTIVIKNEYGNNVTRNVVQLEML